MCPGSGHRARSWRRRLRPSLRASGPHRHQHAGDFGLDLIEQLAEQLEGFALVFLLGLLLGIAAQVDALAQVVQRGQVFAPVVSKLCSSTARWNCVKFS
jgi:hypothetical protein